MGILMSQPKLEKAASHSALIRGLPFQRDTGDRRGNDRLIRTSFREELERLRKNLPLKVPNLIDTPVNKLALPPPLRADKVTPKSPPKSRRIIRGRFTVSPAVAQGKKKKKTRRRK